MLHLLWQIPLLAIALLFLLFLVTLIRTLLQKQRKSEYEPPAEDTQKALPLAKKLGAMIRCETVSDAADPSREKFRAFGRCLSELFPLVHANLEKTEIDGNLLFYWKGARSDKPILLMSHQDVVPAQGDWVHPPFSGEIEDGKIYGRGAADTKCSLMALFEAVEQLLASGYTTPPQDVYLASSCTEEWAGDGAPKIVSELQRRGVELFLLCDEGGAIISEPIGGIPGNFAMVGIFEKGKGDVLFTAHGQGGHASAPGKNTPVARLAAFINETERRSPFRKKLLPPVAAMFAKLAPYATFPLRLILSNLWLFRPLLLWLLPKVSAQGAAMLRTTIAFTTLSGSDAYNVLPTEASVGANLRFIPHQGQAQSLAILRKAAQRHDLTTTVLHANDYTEPVDLSGQGWQLFEKTVKKTFPGICVSPYVMTGATDAQFYQPVCKNCMRFAPVIYGPEQMRGMHGLNECIEASCLPGAVRFYQNLIRAQEEAE